MLNNKGSNKTFKDDKPLAVVLVHKIEGETIKLIALGHEALTKETMKLIEQFGEELILNPEVRSNASLHKEQRVPIFRVLLEKNDVLCQTKYNISGNVFMLHSIASIREEIVKDINAFVANKMNSIIPKNYD